MTRMVIYLKCIMIDFAQLDNRTKTLLKGWPYLQLFPFLIQSNQIIESI